MNTFGMKVLLAKHYIDNLRDEVKKGMLEKVEQGGFPCHAPYGYRNVKEPHSVEVVPEKAAIIRRIFEWYATGRESCESLKARWREAGFVYAPTRVVPSRRFFEQVLKNLFYTGSFDFRGKVYKGAYEAIISKELFDRVQAAFNGRYHHSIRRTVSINYRGLFVCSECGCSITGEIKKGKYTYYHCTRMRGPCREPALREEALEEQIAASLEPFAFDDQMIMLAKASSDERHAKEREARAAERTSMERRTVQLRGFIDRSYEDKLEENITEEFWRTKTTAWRAELADIERRLREKDETAGDASSALRVLELAKKLPVVWVTAKPATRRRIVEIVYSNSMLGDAKLVTKWRKPFDLLVERPSNERWWR